jgi:predicted membrane-bound spermidine synthase
MLLHPSPRNTLVVCFGMGTTYRSAISHGMDVTVVELVKEAYQAFDQFHSDAALVRSYPKGRMLVNDGRNYLKLTREKFDVITIDPPPPVDAAGVNSLYSLELMKLARSRLKPGGVFAHWLPFPGMSGMDEFTFEMIFRTFLDAFPYVYVQTAYNNFGLHVIGSMVPCNPDPVATERRFAGNVVRDAQEWDPVPLAYVTGVQFFVKDNVRSEQLTDDKPLLEFYFLRMLKSGETKLLADSFW